MTSCQLICAPLGSEILVVFGKYRTWHCISKPIHSFQSFVRQRTTPRQQGPTVSVKGNVDSLLRHSRSGAIPLQETLPHTDMFCSSYSPDRTRNRRNNQTEHRNPKNNTDWNIKVNTYCCILSIAVVRRLSMGKGTVNRWCFGVFSKHSLKWIELSDTTVINQREHINQFSNQTKDGKRWTKMIQQSNQTRKPKSIQQSNRTRKPKSIRESNRIQKWAPEHQNQHQNRSNNETEHENQNRSEDQTEYENEHPNTKISTKIDRTIKPNPNWTTKQNKNRTKSKTESTEQSNHQINPTIKRNKRKICKNGRRKNPVNR